MQTHTYVKFVVLTPYIRAAIFQFLMVYECGIIHREKRD